MKILFITSSRIGDAVLSSGLLEYIERNYKDAKVTIVCGPLVSCLFEHYPLADRVIALKKKKYHGHWFDLWRDAVHTHWGMVIDLRNSAVSRLVPAKKRFIFGRKIDGEAHKVVQNAAVMGLFGDNVPAPKLWLSEDVRARAQRIIPKGTAVLGVGPTANWMGKTWPTDRYIKLVRDLVSGDGAMNGARVAVFGAPGEEDIANLLLGSIPENQRIDVIAKGTPDLAAACLARCSVYIGNDSGLMHCAAAAGTPTFGLFGPSKDYVYAPYGSHCGFIRTPETMDELIDYPAYDHKTCGSLMESLTLDAVRGAFEDFLQRQNIKI